MTFIVDRVLKWRPGVVVGLYVLAIMAATSWFSPFVNQGAIPILSAVFAWVYLRLGRGGPWFAVGWVALITLVFPVVILGAMGLSVYGSWDEMENAVVRVASEEGVVGILQLGFPIAAALVVVALVRPRSA